MLPLARDPHCRSLQYQYRPRWLWKLRCNWDRVSVGEKSHRIGANLVVFGSFGSIFGLFACISVSRIILVSIYIHARSIIVHFLYSIFHPCTSPLFLTTFSFINSHISPFCTLSLHCCRCLLILIHRHIFFSTHKLLGQLYTISPLFFFFPNTTYRSLESLPHGFGLIFFLSLSSIMIFFEFPSPTPPHLNLMAPDRLLIPSSSSLSSPTSQPIFGNPGCLEWIAIGPLFLFLIFVFHTYFSDPFRPFHHINLFSRSYRITDGSNTLTLFSLPYIPFPPDQSP